MIISSICLLLLLHSICQTGFSRGCFYSSSPSSSLFFLSPGGSGSDLPLHGEAASDHGADGVLPGGHQGEWPQWFPAGTMHNNLLVLPTWAFHVSICMNKADHNEINVLTLRFEHLWPISRRSALLTEDVFTASAEQFLLVRMKLTWHLQTFNSCMTSVFTLWLNLMKGWANTVSQYINVCAYVQRPLRITFKQLTLLFNIYGRNTGLVFMSLMYI